MQYPGYSTGKVNLVEGEWYSFRIHNQVQLQDNAFYYVLQDINGMKHFMPSKYYEHYGFDIGDEIDCKIDRINCTGRIFLEPKHPFYKEDELYAFSLINFIQKGNDISLFVKGFCENNIEVSVKDKDINCLTNIKMVNCRVKSIHKGNLILELIDISD